MDILGFAQVSVAKAQRSNYTNLWYIENLLNNGSKVEVIIFKLNFLLIIICLLFISLFMPLNMASAEVAEGKPLVELADSKNQSSKPVEEEEEEEGDDDC